MLRDLNISVNGRRDSTSPYVGVRADQIPTGHPLPAFLLNDIDPEFPNRLYSVEILTLPSAGTLYLDKAGAGTFTGAPDGTYTGTQRVQKFDPDVGRVSTADTTYSMQVGAVPDTIKPTLSGTVTAASITQTGFITGCSSATDNIGVTGYGYSINDGASYTAVSGPSATVSGLTANTAYPVKWVAYDAAGNASDPLSLTITTLAVVPTVTGVTLSPAGAVVDAATQQFTWVVAGANNPPQTVTLATTLGAINASGVLTRPAKTAQVQTGTVTATSTLDPTKSGTVSFTVPAELVDNPPATCSVNWQLGEAHGPAANLTGMRVSFATGTGPHDAGPYLFQSANETTDALGFLSFVMETDAITAGESGVLSVLMPDGRHYLGIVPVA